MNINDTSASSRLAAVILAAGEGTRMESSLPKVLHKLSGRPMLEYVLDTTKSLGIHNVVVVVGYKGEEVQKILSDGVKSVEQKQQLGTADAVRQAESILKDFNGDIVVLYGDIPLISNKTIRDMLNIHKEAQASCTLLTVDCDDPVGYGRIIRDIDGHVVDIREEKDATESERQIKEINVGAYIFDGRSLFDTLAKVGCKNKSGEYYLTDTIAILYNNGKKVIPYKTKNAWETIGVNSLENLKKAEESLKKSQATSEL